MRIKSIDKDVKKKRQSTEYNFKYDKIKSVKITHPDYIDHSDDVEQGNKEIKRSSLLDKFFSDTDSNDMHGEDSRIHEDVEPSKEEHRNYKNHSNPDDLDYDDSFDERYNNKPNKGLIAIVKHLGFSAVLSIVFWIVLGIFFSVLYVPSDSMSPTIMPGSFVVVLKVLPHNLDYGVYAYTDSDFDNMLVKRAVGKPNDTLVLTEGALTRNNEQINEDYVKEPDFYSGEFTVPDNCYFFLGDNRLNSIDSRFTSTKYIPRKDIYGKIIISFSSIVNIKHIK